MEAIMGDSEWHSAIGELKLLPETECSWLIRILDNADAESVAAAIAQALDEQVQCVLLDGDYFDADEGDSLSEPLRQGQTVVLVVRGPSPLPASIAEGWHAACESGDTHPGRNLRLHGRSADTTPGRLIIVHIMPGDSPVPRSSKAGHWNFSSIPMLTTDQKKSAPIVRVGVTRLPTTSHPTMKEVCMLHYRDPEGTPVRSIHQMLSSDIPVSWTDVQTLLRSEYDDLVLYWFDGNLTRRVEENGGAQLNTGGLQGA